MELTKLVGERARQFPLGGWLSAYDFDASGISPRERLNRLEYAALQARRRCCFDAGRDELEFVLAECGELQCLLAADDADEGTLETNRVPQRISRVRRVVTYHEGSFCRLNRRYWWVPFTASILLMGASWIHSASIL